MLTKSIGGQRDKEVKRMKYVLITGAYGGMGRAVALALLFQMRLHLGIGMVGV